MKLNDDIGHSVLADEPSKHAEGFQGFEDEGAVPSNSEELEGNDNTEPVLNDFYQFAGKSKKEPEAEVEDPEDEPEVVASTPRAQKRIQQLANERKELNRQNEELLALVEQLKKSNELQERTWSKQNEWLGQQEQASKLQQRRQMMLQYGLNPEDTRDAITFEQMEYKAQLENQLNAIKAQMQEQQYALQVERFNVALDNSLSSELKNFDVDEEVQGHIRDIAFNLASNNRELTAKQAAAEAVKKFKKVLPRKAGKVARKPAVADEAAKAISTGRRGKATSKSIEDMDFEELLNTGNFAL